MDQLLYKYAKIDLEQFAIFEENISSPIGEVKFECVVQFDYDKEHDVLCSKLIMTMKDGDKTLLRAVMCSYFIIAKESVEQITNDKAQLIFTPMVLVQFASLNYGSLRGALSVKCQNTPLADYVLPPIYLGQTIDQSFIVD
ncbi:MAG: hypothetical protein ACMV14_05245 [Prevotella sp.]|jgi:hypothetical protein